MDFKNGEKIPKTEFKRELSRKEKIETFVNCAKCTRNFHRICENYDENLDGEFVCEDCLPKKRRDKNRLILRASTLPETSCSRFMKQKYETHLKGMEGGKSICNKYNITIRVLSDTRSEIPPKPEFAKFSKLTYIYRHRTIFVYQRVDGEDVLFFGIHLHLFHDTNNPQSNQKLCYLAYMDSVLLIEDSKIRRKVYQALLLALFSYICEQGYETLCIWACPPKPGDDYIFHAKPPFQKNLHQIHLKNWYENLFEIAEQSMLGSYERMADIIERLEQFSVKNNVAYFDEDLWCTKIDECLNKCFKESNEVSMAPLNAVKYSFFYRSIQFLIFLFNFLVNFE